MDQKNLRKLQLLQLEILKDIDKICTEHHLTYYMVGGTLLGAVRHNGFIPWDDDIDIAMYREDYNKIQKILISNMSDKYFVQNFYTDRYYTRYIAKVRLKGTRQVEKGLAEVDSHKGVYVDIFPLDYVKKKSGLELWVRGAIVRCLFAYKTMRVGTNHEMVKAKQVLKQLLRWITFLIPNAFVNRLFDYSCSKDNGKACLYTTSFASRYRWKRQLYTNSVFGKGTRLDYEGCRFNAPVQYETILKRIYGNYLEFPPEEKRYEGHKLVEIAFGEYDALLEQKVQLVTNEKV